MEEELREISERVFQAYGSLLENVTAFKYLGRVMKVGDDDWTEVSGNLQEARKIWGWVSRILSLEGADPKLLGHFFKAEVQEVLLFGVDMWVLNPSMERDMSSFHHRVAQLITRRHPRRRGGWELVLSSAGGSNGGSGSGLQGDWGLRHEEE